MASALAIIADDLTGAADAAAPFATAGLVTRLLLDTSQGDIAGCAVVAVSTGTRAMPSVEAGDIVRREALRLRSQGVRQFYKKIDSTLRGNVAAEIAAMLEVMGSTSIALVCPAFPAMARTMRDGRLFVGDQPLSQAESARDLVTPVLTDRLVELLGEIGSIATIPVETVREGPDSIVSVLAAKRPRIAIIDAVETGDLATIAEASELLDRPALNVGSGGLASALARRRGSASTSAMSARVLVVVGSRHGQSRAQLAHLTERPDVEVAEFDIASMRPPGMWEDVAHGLARTDAGIIAITTKLTGADAAPASVAERLADLVLVLAADGIAGLVVTGGDIAEAILKHAGASGLDLVGQAAPGLPISRVIGGSLTEVVFVTKSGGFGATTMLSCAADAAYRSSEGRHP